MVMVVTVTYFCNCEAVVFNTLRDCPPDAARHLDNDMVDLMTTMTMMMMITIMLMIQMMTFTCQIISLNSSGGGTFKNEKNEKIFNFNDILDFQDFFSP